ncbi:VTT domain-containing protein [Shewanella inventionis]|jgi:uncharacterized membrane protein YdjX (TVP38/TMEM64 family)|uniref:TVP38/TMEM64 family membrane protein n=1 Tax=Shewanella inventionis TaxID=1738770 RepID=A0ABQ1JUD9_9GAMM|nr:VTT domain-containing protein [Shewanella inventionis]MCL1159926.1 VTT domain-containing protein [Shewanella inventionis]UAL43943.1 VTT domain-containing protein [Shewanella inventionis]GGB74885.1 TVP38/TMEM64 family protein [Shewanella inventionis]
MTERLLALIRVKWLKRAMILLTICIFGGAIVANNMVFQSFNENWIDAHIRNNGFTGMLLFLGLGAIATALGSPRQLLAFFGGYAFGFVNGALLSTLSAGLGCILSMYFARFAVRKQIKQRYPQKISAIDRFLAKSPFTKTIVIRLLPIGNNLVTNLVAGVSHVSGLSFVLGSLIGYLPQMAIFALMGKGVIVLSIWKVVLSIALFVISSLLSVRLYKQYKADSLIDDSELADLENMQRDEAINK